MLFWEHGKACKRCAIKGRTSKILGFTERGICPMEKYVRRERGTPRPPKFEEEQAGEVEQPANEEVEEENLLKEVEKAEEKLELINPAIEQAAV